MGFVAAAGKKYLLFLKATYIMLIMSKRICKYLPRESLIVVFLGSVACATKKRECFSHDSLYAADEQNDL